jgi:hypothetical protein
MNKIKKRTEKRYQEKIFIQLFTFWAVGKSMGAWWVGTLLLGGYAALAGTINHYVGSQPYMVLFLLPSGCCPPPMCR